MSSHGAAALSIDTPLLQNSTTLDEPVLELRLRQRYPTARLSVGLTLYLVSIGLVASATIVVFFGVAFLLLLEPADETTRRAGSPKPVAEIGPLVHRLWPASDNFGQPTAGIFEQDAFSQPLPNSGEATGSSIGMVVARPAADEGSGLPSRGAEIAQAASSPAASLFTEAGMQAGAVPTSREVLTVASTRSTPTVSAAPTDTTPVPLAASIHSGLSAADIAELLDRGDALLRIGDIASARLFYERAADAGSGQAALRLATSLNPAFLVRAGLGKMQANVAQAQFWYRRAVDLEAAEPDRRLSGDNLEQGH
jgi:hypothetical protein